MRLPSWLTLPTVTTLNRIAWRLSAALVGTVALVAVLLHPMHLETDVVATPPAAPLLASAPQPAGTAVNGESVTDTQRRIDFCSQHVTSDRSFVVFANGTCVIVNEPTANPIQDAIDLIKKCSGPDARFITRRIEADSYMITYREPIFHCLFADEVEQLGPVVRLSYPNFLAESERRAQPAGWEPPFDAKLGLLTRTFLNADAREQQVAKVIRAMPISGIDLPGVQASNSH